MPVVAHSQSDSFAWTPSLSATTDVLSPRAAATVAIGRLEAHVEFDFSGKRSIVLDAAAISGGDVTARTGATQAVSNIEAPRSARVLDLFAKWPVGKGGMARIGVIDLNAFFYVQGDAAASFLNGSHGIGPEFSQSSPRGPSVYPNTSFGAVVEHPVNAMVLRVGSFLARANSAPPDGAVATEPKGALLIGEVDAGTTRAGAWSYTSSMNGTSGDAGAYAIVESKPAPSVDAWFTAGASNARFNPVNSYVGGGFALTEGKLTWGAAAASAGFPGRAPRETNLEFIALRSLPGGWSIQPDLQWIAHPSGARFHTWVAGLRVSYEFSGAPHRHARFIRRHRLGPVVTD